MNFKITPNTLKKLEHLFDEARYIIRFEKGTFNSGYCILEDKRVVVINKFLNLEGRITALVDLLPNLKMDSSELDIESAKLYKQIMDASSANPTSIQTQIEL